MAKTKKTKTVHLRGAAAQRFVDAAMREDGRNKQTRQADDRPEKICIGCGGRVKEGEIPTCGH